MDRSFLCVAAFQDPIRVNSSRLSYALCVRSKLFFVILLIIETDSFDLFKRWAADLKAQIVRILNKIFKHCR